jgi:hypothetical protein
MTNQGVWCALQRGEALHPHRTEWTTAPECPPWDRTVSERMNRQLPQEVLAAHSPTVSACRVSLAGQIERLSEDGMTGNDQVALMQQLVAAANNMSMGPSPAPPPLSRTPPLPSQTPPLPSQTQPLPSHTPPLPTGTPNNAQVRKHPILQVVTRTASIE